jgi:hypothetical protein
LAPTSPWAAASSPRIIDASAAPAAGDKTSKESIMSVHELAKLAVRAVLVGGAGLAIVAPSAGARPITDLPMHAAAPARQAVASPSVQRHEPAGVLAPQSRQLIRRDLGAISGAVATNQTPAHHTPPATPQTASGGFDWVTAAIGGVALTGIVGLIWLSAAAISRVTRTRVAN